MAQKITKIEQQQKNKERYNVYLDDEFAFGVSEMTLVKFRLAKGLEIEKGQIEQITGDDEIAKAYSKALDYLSYAPRAESEIITKLKSLELPDETIETVLGMLREQNLIDDQSYANSYVRTMKVTSDKGPSVIRQNLRAKKIGENLIENALQEFSGAELLENATKVAEKAAKHYARQPEKMRQQKIRQAMMTKGFTSEITTEVLNSLELETDPSDEWYNLSVRAEKIWQRNRRYAYRERVQRTKRTMFSKGYAMDDVNRWIEEQGEE